MGLLTCVVTDDLGLGQGSLLSTSMGVLNFECRAILFHVKLAQNNIVLPEEEEESTEQRGVSKRDKRRKNKCRHVDCRIILCQCRASGL